MEGHNYQVYEAKLRFLDEWEYKLKKKTSTEGWGGGGGRYGYFPGILWYTICGNCENLKRNTISSTRTLINSV